jgi:DNA polymerase-3 subunit beta
MQFMFNRKEFLCAFQTVTSVFSKGDLCANVRIEVDDKHIVLIGADSEIGIRTKIFGCQIKDPGNVVLSIPRYGQIIRKILQKSKNEYLDLFSDKQKTTIRGQRSEVQMMSENTDEHPVHPSFEEEKYHELSARLFRKIVHRTAFATDNESSRYALGGVLLELESERITAVASDGARLARQEGPVQSIGVSGDAMTIIPTRAMQLLERVLDKSSSHRQIQLAVCTNGVLVRSGQTTIYAKSIEGRFPKWRNIIPSHTDGTKIELVVGSMLAAVRQAAIVTSEEHRGVDFTFADGKAVLIGQGTELGESHVELPITYDGAEIRITLNPVFVSDFLRALDAERTFTIELHDAESPVVCKTDDGYVYVIMPLQKL